MRTLRKGDTGADVITLQNALNKAGCKLTVDGSFGTKTQEAVCAFQVSHTLLPDGVVGTLTWEALEPFMENPTKPDKLREALTDCIKAVENLPEFKTLEAVLNG